MAKKKIRPEIRQIPVGGSIVIKGLRTVINQSVSYERKPTDENTNGKVFKVEIPPEKEVTAVIKREQ